MRTILYNFLEHKKINGSLFYCFEYYVFCRDQGHDVEFVIYNILDVDFVIIKQLFSERYVFNLQYLSGLRQLNSIKDLHALDSIKTLILDVHTFERTFSFIQNDIVCFSNECNRKKRSSTKNVKYFGSYSYQSFDEEAELKLNFNIFRPLSKVKKDSIFISSPHKQDVLLPDKYQGRSFFVKDNNKHYENLFENFSTLYYCHGGLDTDNRLIPECFFYETEVVLELNNFPVDSVQIRYDKIKKYGVEVYNLTAEDPMLMEFLS